MTRMSQLWWQGLVSVLVVALIIEGCAATRARRGEPAKSGFLGNYSGLARNEDYAAALVYVRPNVQWGGYNAIQLESAGLYVVDDKSKPSPEDQERLAGMLYNTMTSALTQHFTLASEPGPGTLRLRVALTQAQGASVVARTATTIIPQLRLLTTVGGLASDTAVTVGTATLEMEALDSTNERLAAAVDERAGTKALFTKRAYQEWGDVQAAMDYWSKRLTWQLARHGVQLKPGAGMPEEPKELRSF